MSVHLTVDLPTRRATRRLASALAGALHPGDLVVLEGDLGAGKTFFVRGVARGLGVPARTPITSPTFGLVHEIDGARLPLVHADLYRLGDESELEHLGLLSRIGNDAVVMVEWGREYAASLGDFLLLELTLGASGRRALLSAEAGRALALLEQTAVLARSAGLNVRGSLAGAPTLG